MDFSKLSEFATCDLDLSICRAMATEGSQSKAGKALGMPKTTLGDRLRKLVRYAATKGYSPATGLNNLPTTGQFLHGVSTLEDGEGNVQLRWVKTRADYQAALDAAKAMVDEMNASIRPEEPVEAPVHSEDDLLSLYVLTDAHLGMYAHHEEGGDNWDIKIAENTINSAFDYLSSNTPESSTAILCNLGDLLHSDGTTPMTPTSHHVLDQDSRHHRVIRTAIRVIRNAMRTLLQQHQRVILVNAQGNHDLASALWMQESFSVLYEEEPRADVLVSPLPYYAIQHGANLLAFAHGHKKSGKQLVDLINGQFRHLIGKTQHTYIHTGHKHQQELIETPTSTVEQHPTLAARDSFASHGGWLSKRGMQAIVYHKEHLEVGRCMFRPQQVKE